MNKLLVTIGVAFFAALPLSANGSTKHLECIQTGTQGKVLYIQATISDSSDQAEVQLYYAGASCAKDKTCDTEVFEKHVLPTVMRLTKNDAGEIADSYVIDINRSDLTAVTRATVNLFDKVAKDTLTGKCTAKVETEKNVI